MAKKINEMTVAELKKVCRRLGLSVSGNKAALISRIEAKVAELEELREARAAEAEKAIAANEGDLFAQFSAAVKTGAIAKITYENRFGRVTKREIVPLYTYELVDPKTGEVYQYACCACFRVRDFRNFALSRIQSIEWTGETYKVKPLLYPKAENLAGRKPLKAYALSEREIMRNINRGWATKPVVGLRRPVRQMPA